ncbi:LysR substrate-binding domain-containing protein [Sneathiella glossodoripedis]|uniref:LysR substrate-binding domain-containing protein n=1 Tax=Sneathiella glossodoripedis TaxID=418853 RepID=UPI000686E39A|nr:LysR substrate-binding domain-containing protein [Sneathiella glossodoripedis]
MNLDLKSLEIFVCVVEEGKISKAAKKLNRVQSNVSTRIKQLEAEVGKQLFVRSARSLQLTAEGGLLLEYAKQMLQLREQASLALGDDTPKGILRVGAMESTAAARLPSIIQTFSHKYPDLHVDLVTDTAAGLISRLADGRVECVFAAKSAADFRFASKTVFHEELVLVAPETMSHIKEYEDLENVPLVAFEKGCAYRGYLEDWVKLHHIKPSTILSMNSYLAIISCVSAGSGFAVIPRSVLNLFRKAFPVRELGTPSEFKKIPTLLMWQKGPKSNNFAAFSREFHI